MRCYLHFHAKWNATEGNETPAGNACQRETPQAGSRAARGKRVPEVE
ncbi:hypothetical protein [Peribacillus simplex]|nr:hypothetical protein [Peribacillus simplex]